MTEGNNTPKYIIVSPVKDEQKYLARTIDSVVRQTVKPLKWVIVDDGSEDRTQAILIELCTGISWIEVVRIERDVRRVPGSAVIQAFNAGLDLVQNMGFEFIVKLDCDLQLECDYFEKLLNEFSKDSKLGIASGVYLEDRGQGPKAVNMPDYHAAGASKILRRQCFEEIRGFVPHKGWDTVDEIKAQSRGWKTCHFKAVTFHHLKLEGSGIGNLRTNRMHGEIYYLTGGSKWFFCLKVLHRMIFGRPILLGGVMMLIGYVSLAVARKELLVTETEARFYRQMLSNRILKGSSRSGLNNPAAVLKA